MLKYNTISVTYTLILAALLRVYQLDSQSLWADEGNSVALARRSFGEITRRTAFDIHPPLYYWLLKIWVVLFGDSEIGLRSLSVVLGVILVYLIGVLGTRLFTPRVGRIAAFIAALSPLQIYYAQEARMYMLLTVLSTLTVLIAFWLFAHYLARLNETPTPPSRTPNLTLTALLYILTVTAGLYTHYAYPLILIVVNLTALFLFWSLHFKATFLPGLGRTDSLPVDRRPKTEDRGPTESREAANFPRLQSPNLPTSQSPNLPISQLPITHYQLLITTWPLLHLIPFLLYLPWLPIAWRQLTTWPSERLAAPFLTILETTATTLLLGLSWPFNLGAAIVAGLSLILLLTLPIDLKHLSNIKERLADTVYSPPSLKNYAIRNTQYAIRLLTWLWLLLPVGLILFIFTPAFLKFLLVAAPPLALLLAVAVDRLTIVPRSLWPSRVRSRKSARRPGWSGYLTGGFLLSIVAGASLLSLYHYYENVVYARDNYRGIVNFIKAVGGPGDVIILNAEGQQDVFNYYYEQPPRLAAPVYPLPRSRPLDEVATVQALQDITAGAKKIYAVYWAAEQADPQGLIEGWLNAHLFKATDQWYGNVRLVSYAAANLDDDFKMTPVDYQLGPHIRLTGFAVAADEVTAGDILQIGLRWETSAVLRENYTVFVQILDQANHLVGQRDAQPLQPAAAWSPDEPVEDAHGVYIEPGTPPGGHRLIVGLYNSETGRRLPVVDGEEPAKDFVELTRVEIEPPAVPLPREAFTIRTPLSKPLLEATLLGYDLYKLGHRSNPEAPLHPGEPVQVVAYWQARQPVRGLHDQLTLQLLPLAGQTPLLSVTRPLAGVDYPVSTWPAGAIVRAQYSFTLDSLTPGRYRLAFTMQDKNSEREVTVKGEPFRVE